MERKGQLGSHGDNPDGRQWGKQRSDQMCGLVRKWMCRLWWGPGVSELQGGGEERRVLDGSRGQRFLGG